MGNTENANKLRQDTSIAKQNNKSKYDQILLERILNIESRLTLLESRVKEIVANEGKSKEVAKESKTETKAEPKDKEANNNKQK